MMISQIEASRLAKRQIRHYGDEALFWRRQTCAAWALNGITLFAAVAALATVVVLILTLRDTRSATIEANRAWIAPRSVYLTREFVLNDHPVFRLAYDNFGRAPAINNELWWQVAIVNSDTLITSLKNPDIFNKEFGENVACAGKLARKGAEPIWPSPQTEAYSNFYSPNPNDPVITPEVMDGRQAVMIRGCIVYETFDEPHHSTFCFWFRRGPSSDILTTKAAGYICPGGNDAT
jgi:hypothetical protein